MTSHGRKSDNMSAQFLKFIDFKFGPAFIAIIFAAGMFWMRYDGAVSKIDTIAKDFYVHADADREKFEALKNLATAHDTIIKEVKARVSRIENKLDASGNPVERR